MDCLTLLDSKLFKMEKFKMTSTEKETWEIEVEEEPLKLPKEVPESIPTKEPVKQ